MGCGGAGVCEADFGVVGAGGWGGEVALWVGRFFLVLVSLVWDVGDHFVGMVEC